MAFLEPVRNFYTRYERPISSFSLVLGFIIDALTLKRADKLWENLWILGYIILIGIFIILIHSTEHTEERKDISDKTHFWYVNILQFCLGGALSANLVLYYRSASIFVVWPFILILIIAFWANESLKAHHTRFSFQITLFFLSIYSFMIFFLPVVFHRLGALIFLISGLLSLAIISLFVWLVFYFTKDRFAESKKLITCLVLGIFALMNFLYFTNLIPPIPLALKDAGVYYSISKVEGGYEAVYEDLGWKQHFIFSPDFKKLSGSPAYVFSAIFSPKNLNLTILHEWQYYDPNKKDWVTERIINLPVTGGRDGGFRTYSMRRDLREGKWRVNIETGRGQTIGQVRFTVVAADDLPKLKTVIK